MKAVYRIVAEAGNQDVYLYGDIGYWGVTADQFRRDMAGLDKAKPISLHIHSAGGDVFDGMAIHTLLSQWPAGVTVTVDGLAASMASVIAMAGGTVRIARGGWMMIHNPWSAAMGDADELRKTADLLDGLRDSLADAYATHTGAEREAMVEMMDAETWLNAEQAVDLGFADEIMDGPAVAASVNTSRLSAAPPEVRDWLAKMEAAADADASPASEPVPDATDVDHATDGTASGASPAAPAGARDQSAWEEGYDAGAAAARDVIRTEMAAEKADALAKLAAERDASVADLTAKLDAATQTLEIRDRQVAEQAAALQALSAKLDTLRVGLAAPGSDVDNRPTDFPAAVARVLATGADPINAHVEARRRWPELHAAYVAAANATK